MTTQIGTSEKALDKSAAAPDAANGAGGEAPWRGRSVAGRKRHKSQSSTAAATVDAEGLETPEFSVSVGPPAPPRRTQGPCGSPPRAPAWSDDQRDTSAAAGTTPSLQPLQSAPAAGASQQHTWAPQKTQPTSIPAVPPRDTQSQCLPTPAQAQQDSQPSWHTQNTPSSPPPPPPPPPPARRGSMGLATTRPRSNSVPGLAQPAEVPDEERPESVWDYTETGGWRRPGRWPSAHSVRPDPEECVDTLR